MRLANRLLVPLCALVFAGAISQARGADDKPKSPPAPPAPFQGEVVKVAASSSTEGKIWVKHANGTLKMFHVHGSTKVSGASNLKAVTKGSMVTIESGKKGTAHVNVTKLAPPPPPDKESGGPVHGTVVKVHSDSFGDTGTIVVKTAHGATREFQVTNATSVSNTGHKDDSVHSLQFVTAGQSVTIEHDGGKTALMISVNTAKK